MQDVTGSGGWGGRYGLAAGIAAGLFDGIALEQLPAAGAATGGGMSFSLGPPLQAPQVTSARLCHPHRFSALAWGCIAAAVDS